MVNIADDVSRALGEIIGKPCTRVEVGNFNSLSLGFGEPTRPTAKHDQKDYRDWEIGTYRSAWRVVKQGLILCGSRDAVESVQELNAALRQIQLGRFSSLSQPTELDVRIDFDSGIAIDFLAATGDNDESFHIFCPGAVCVEFVVHRGWKIGPSDKPWGM